ncbi:MAG TPA: alpha-(1-_3)-arabinofuranosyltransferase family protein [Candidatus Rubrimentiphilum sp.]|nr:alpha-(1->3)-arabinofuranosyltransferase family protein [Candidatus Rubrimentiphilum sp.]
MSQGQARSARASFENLWKSLSDRPTLAAGVVAILLYARSIRAGYLILGGDTDGSFLDPYLALQRAFDAWAYHIGLGNDNTPAIGQIPVYAFETALHFLGLAPWIVQCVTYAVVFALIPTGICYYVRTVFPQRPLFEFFAGLASITNFYVALMWYTPVLPYEFGIIGSCFIAASALAFARNPGARSTLMLCLAVALSYGGGSNAAVAAMMFLVSAILIYSGAVAMHVSVRRLLVACAVIVGMSLAWFVPTVVFFASEHALISGSTYSAAWGYGTLVATSGSTTIQNAIRLIGSWNWDHSDAAGHAYVPFATWYTRNPLLFLLSFLLPVVALVGVMLRSRAKIGHWKLVIGISLGCSIFFMKGIAPPFGWLFNWLFDHLPGFNVFRDPFSKFGLPAAVFMALLAGLGADYLISAVRGNYKKVAALGLTAGFLISLAPYLAGQMFRSVGYADMPSYYVHMPASYSEAADYLNKIPNQGKRLLVLPFSPQISYTTFLWGFNGPDPLQFIIRRPVIFEPGSWADPYTAVAVGGVDQSASALRLRLRELNIGYALIHRDIDTSFYGAVPAQKVEQLVVSAGGSLERVFGKGELALYSFRDEVGHDYRLSLLKGALGVPDGLRERIEFGSIDFFSGGSNTAINKVSRLRAGSHALVAFPSTMRFDGTHDLRFIVPDFDFANMVLGSPGATGLSIDNSAVTNGETIDLTPGAHTVSTFSSVIDQGSRWQKPVREAGIAEVMPLPSVSGNRIVLISLNLPNFPDNHIGLTLECCAGPHRRHLTGDVSVALDGAKHTLAIPINLRDQMDLRVAAYGDGMPKLSPFKALVRIAQIVTTQHIVVPAFLSLEPTRDLQRLPPETYLLRSNRTITGTPSRTDEIVLTTPMVDGPLDRPATYAVELPQLFGLAAASAPALRAAGSSGPAIAIPNWTKAGSIFSVDRSPVSRGTSVTLAKGIHRFTEGRNTQSRIVARSLLLSAPSTAGQLERLSFFPVVFPSAGRWLLTVRYTISGGNAGAGYASTSLSHSSKNQDIALVSDGKSHSTSFFFVTDAESRGFIEIYGTYSAANAPRQVGVTLSAISSQRLYNVPPEFVFNNVGKISGGVLHSPYAESHRLARLENGGDLPEVMLFPSRTSDSFSVYVPGPGVLQLDNAANPNWIASNGGHLLQKVLVNNAFDGWLITKPGRVAISYRMTRARTLSAAASAAALCLLLIGLLVVRRRALQAR